MTLWLDDLQKQSLTFIDNDTRPLTDVRLGAQGIETGTRGTVYFDDFESRRFSYIGTLPDPGVDDPQATNQAGWFTRTYAYSASIPHAVVSVTSEPPSGTSQSSVDSYEYDLNGNMICRIENGVTFKQDYNAENRISAIHKLALSEGEVMNGNCETGSVIESWLYAYDGDGVRVASAHYTGVTQDSFTSYFMGGAYEVTGSQVKKYYSLAGQTIMKDSDGSLKYLLTDHLGSTSAVVDANGSLLSQQRYLPFGEVRTDTNPPYVTQTDFGYTGQRNLSGTGLMDYRARFYSIALGRFIQPDALISNPYNPQDWNRFSYVNNSPVNFSDPSGHIKCSYDAAGNDYCVPGNGGGNAPEKLPLLIFATEGNRQWTDEEQEVLNSGAYDVAKALARDINHENLMLWKLGEIDRYNPMTPTEAFYSVYDGPVTVIRKAGTCSDVIGDLFPGCGAWGFSNTKNEIWIFDNATPSIIKAYPRLIVHELGHSFDKITGMSSDMPSNLRDRNGFFGPASSWQLSTDTRYTEIFADMFVGVAPQ